MKGAGKMSCTSNAREIEPILPYNFFYVCPNVFSLIVFSILFRASNHQIVDIETFFKLNQEIMIGQSYYGS